MRDEWKYGIALAAIFLIIVTGSAALNPDSGHPAETEGDVVNAPEFPSVFLPAMMLIGIIGFVLHCRQTTQQN